MLQLTSMLEEISLPFCVKDDQHCEIELCYQHRLPIIDKIRVIIHFRGVDGLFHDSALINILLY